VKRLCLWLIRLYQKHLSPQKVRPTCRFLPTCSQYAFEAIERHGVLLGGMLAFWRILRCNPFNRGPMIDYVPERFLWSKGKD